MIAPMGEHNSKKTSAESMKIEDTDNVSDRVKTQRGRPVAMFMRQLTP